MLPAKSSWFFAGFEEGVAHRIFSIHIPVSAIVPLTGNILCSPELFLEWKGVAAILPQSGQRCVLRGKGKRNVELWMKMSP